MSEPIKKPNQMPDSYSPKTPEIIGMAESYTKSISSTELQAFVASSGEPPRGSNFIKDIRRLYFDNKSENFHLEGCLASVMKAIGENEKFDFQFFLLLSGAHFTQVYSYGDVYNNAACGSSNILNPGLVRHVLNICGYDSIYIDIEMIANQPKLVMDAIKASINNGIPVITKGIGNLQSDEMITETYPEWSLIGGYDEDDVLLLNIPDENISTDEHGYIKAKNGLDKSKGMFILGNKNTNPEYTDILKCAFNSIPIFITMPGIHYETPGKDVHAFYVGVWPLAAGTYDPALDAAGIPDGAKIFGLFDAQYKILPEPANIPEYILVKTMAELTQGKYHILATSSGFSYIIIISYDLQELKYKAKPNTVHASFGQQAFYDWADTLIDENINAATAMERYWGAAVSKETMWCYFRMFYDRFIDDLPEYELPIKIKDIYYKIYTVPEPEKSEYFATREDMTDIKFRGELARWARTIGDMHDEILELFK